MKARLVAVIALAVLLTGVTLGWAVSRRPAPVTADPGTTLHGPGLLVRDTATGHLAVVGPDGRRRQTGVECARAYAAGGHALCLQRDPRSALTYRLVVLDDTLATLRSVPVNGVPSRARVSADGRMLAFTVFVSGDSYLSSGLSTRTGVLDLGTGVLVGSLEDFTVGGHRPPTDANFWGVSFADDDNTFYATMSSGGRISLVQGDFAASTLTVLDDDVECPSLSPDGTRLVYKRRLPDRSWRLEVYDLDTHRRTRLAETRTVDDQAAWLDENTVGYAVVRPGGLDVWSVPADGTGAPTMLAADAESPSVLH